MSEGHTSVLLAESIDGLAIEPQDTVVDATLGGAGHFRKIIEKLGSEGTLLGIDADADAITRAKEAVSELPTNARPIVHIVQNNFRNLGDILVENNLPEANKFLFDLGWSGYQLSSGKGFSFQTDEPLVMTYGSGSEGTAADVVNSTPEEELANIIYEFGEEQFSRKIAKAIVERRQKERILTTFQLVDAIKEGTPVWYQKRRLHPATKTFQALRIYVNDEFGALREGLAAALAQLGRITSEGRIAVITFHSSEDRIVKNIFRDAAEEGQGMMLPRKPIIAGPAELLENPRSRSAKLRIFVKNQY